MAKRKAPHHQGTFQARSNAVRAAAYTNPHTRCWRCHHTLDEIRATKPRATWTAGHLIDGLTGGPLAPECSCCNFAAGARLTNAKRGQRRTRLTW